MVIAKKFPRDETASFNRILTACKRKSLAECAVYSYPRGGTAVTGPSIRLAECLAQNWGNMDFGVLELDQRNGESQVMAYAWDLETNTRQTKIFTVKHERRVGKGKDFRIDVLTDPRDIYEMVANNGARRLRACILGIIPGDVVDAAVDQCDVTIQDKDAKTPLVDKLRKLPACFDRFGVSQAMLETKIGHKLDDATSREYSELLKIYNALKDNMAKVPDFFPPEAFKPVFTAPSTAAQPAASDGDLGPQKPQEAPEPPKATNTPEAPKESPEATVKRQCKALKTLLGMKGHDEVQLMRFLAAEKGLDDSLGTLSELGKVAPQMLGQIHDTFGKIEVELKAWKEAAVKV
jgi:hypothetical protein